MYFKVISNLTVISAGEEIDFKGCLAEVVGDTTSCLFVKFYDGLPFMIGRQRFYSLTDPIQKPQIDESMTVADVTLWSGDTRIKTYRTLLPPDDPEYLSVKRNALMWFKLTHGQHYDRITHESVNQISNNSNKTTMAKKATTTEATENTATGVALFEDQAKKVNLPAIPKVMTIGGIEFSEELIKKEVDAAKKVKLKSEDDEATYLELVELKKRFVKTRTAPDNFRDKEVRKPIAAWLTELKKQTDAYGNLAQEGQDHCEEQIAIYENWKEAKEREEAERVQKLIDQRTVDLQSVAGVINRDSLHWTFPYLPSKLVENSFLEEADDSEWGGLMKELEDAYAADKAKQAKEREEFEQAKNAVYNTRLQMLQLVGGYESPNPGTYTKNGHTLTEEQIRNTPESDWFTLVQSHSTPAAAHNPFGQATGTAPQSSQTTNPFSQPGNILNIAQESVEATGTGASNNPFAKFVKEVEQKPEADENEVQGVDHTVPHTIWDNTFVEKPLGKTTIRIFPTEHVKEGSKLPEGSAIAFDGKWDNGLMFIIYKAAQQ